MDAFVTCIYNGLHNTSFGGRNMRNARYRDSLINIANTGAKIFCFTSSANLQELKIDFSRYSNIELIVQDLDKLEISPKIQEIKKNNPGKYSDIFWTQRCVEIMWGKFFMIKHIIENNPEYTKLFWIDAGLFHNDVIAPKYFSNNDPGLKNAGVGLFNPMFMEKLNHYIDDLIIIAQQANPHNKPIDSKYNKRAYQNAYGAVGGLFGGSSYKMKLICESFIEKMNALLEDNVICSEESILSGVFCDNPEWFKTYIFRSWYHNGWGDRHDPKQNTFSDIFDEILADEVISLQDGIIFCSLAAGERFRNYTKDFLIPSFLDKVEESIKLLIFTDDITSYDDYGPRVIFKHIDVPCVNCAFHYGLKYKVISETQKTFNNVDKIFYLDADCHFKHEIKKSDFNQAIEGINVPLGNSSKHIVNPAILRKHKNLLSMFKDIPEEIRQFRECAMIFKIVDIQKFNDFVNEWKKLYEYTRDNNLALSGECMEITYASIKSTYPLNDISHFHLFRNLKNNLHTILLNTSAQAIF